jgi:prophage regulatory protein
LEGTKSLQKETSVPTLNQNDISAPRTPSSPARLLRLPEVIARVGLKRSAIYQRMSDGTFPRSRSLGPKCAVWVEAEIDAWIDKVVQAP